MEFASGKKLTWFKLNIKTTRNICSLQAQNASMEGAMDLYPSPADLRKQQVADLQAKRQEKV